MVAETKQLLPEEMLERFRQRAAAYDRENRFFQGPRAEDGRQTPLGRSGPHTPPQLGRRNWNDDRKNHRRW